MWLSEDTIAEPLTKTERKERGRYKSRTGSTRTASPDRINSDRIKNKNKNKTKLDSDQLGAIKKIKLNQQN